MEDLDTTFLGSPGNYSVSKSPHLKHLYKQIDTLRRDNFQLRVRIHIAEQNVSVPTIKSKDVQETKTEDLKEELVKTQQKLDDALGKIRSLKKLLLLLCRTLREFGYHTLNIRDYLNLTKVKKEIIHDREDDDIQPPPSSRTPL